jgi:hypothetical protein
VRRHGLINVSASHQIRRLQKVHNPRQKVHNPWQKAQVYLVNHLILRSHCIHSDVFTKKKIALQANQIRLTTERTKQTDVGTISSLSGDGAVDPSGTTGTVFSVAWPGFQSQVAKKFRLVADFNEEVANLRTVGLIIYA